jgi:hypothetical protein
VWRSGVGGREPKEDVKVRRTSTGEELVLTRSFLIYCDLFLDRCVEEVRISGEVIYGAIKQRLACGGGGWNVETHYKFHVRERG